MLTLNPVSMSLRARWSVVVVMMVVGGVVSGCKGDEPPVPVSIVLSAPLPTSAVVGSTVGTPQIEVHDEKGKAIRGRPVTVSVSGGGTFTPLVTETGRGPTSLGSWVLGTTAGVQTLTVSSGQLPPLILSVQATAGAPASTVRGPGEPGINAGVLGAVSSYTPSITVRDGFGNPVPGVAVAVTIVGGGTVQFPNPVTNASGVASVGAWTFGQTPCTQTVTMRASALPAQVFNATVNGPFEITLRFIGAEPSASVRAAFTSAACRIASIVTADLPPVTLTNFDYAAECLSPGSPVLSETVDDLLILVRVAPDDGVGGRLGFAGPCDVRDFGTDFRVYIGDMSFDEADIGQLLAAGQLSDVILHEMLHVVGVGILWRNGVMNLLVGQGGPDPMYIGASGRAAYLALGGNSLLAGVPIENDGGSGTRDGHWRESVFGRELMTGFLNGGVTNPLSRITLGALADFGYAVNLAAADAYTISAGYRAALGIDATRGHTELRMPRVPGRTGRAIVPR